MVPLPDLNAEDGISLVLGLSANWTLAEPPRRFRLFRDSSSKCPSHLAPILLRFFARQLNLRILTKWSSLNQRNPWGGKEIQRTPSPGSIGKI